ncbi:hypothetical protein [Nocardia cyriacigeorgica]|uniref:hypothetical protein n=1 Tax=Nocardia cyriacigeorgica TaxID=135487 RepID=UPI00031C1347|nr:hypothetical protein [Nocardia cyriacigeorgica]AVH21183.1 hypothetical protein C5B73_06575 [Nocardia cyriacigeorgica]PPJ07608.1 hypothetical protein C5E43_18200 [Nocardia cyriacigeorgica]
MCKLGAGVLVGDGAVMPSGLVADTARCGRMAVAWRRTGRDQDVPPIAALVDARRGSAGGGDRVGGGR